MEKRSKKARKILLSFLLLRYNIQRAELGYMSFPIGDSIQAINIPISIFGKCPSICNIVFC